MREPTAADIFANTCEFAQASAEADLRRIAEYVTDHGGKIPPVEFYTGVTQLAECAEAVNSASEVCKPGAQSACVARGGHERQLQVRSLPSVV